MLTSWTLIRAVGAGANPARDEFARRYEPVIRAFFRARWRGRFTADVEDGVQEVLLRCMNERSPLDRVDPQRAGGFRPFLAGICRKVALEQEARGQRAADLRASRPPELDETPGREDRLSVVFNKSFALQVFDAAREIHRARAEEQGAEALRRFELLRARFEDQLPIRRIAADWEVEASVLHREYARAREEFHRALIDAVRSYSPDATRAELDAEVQSLLAALSGE